MKRLLVITILCLSGSSLVAQAGDDHLGWDLSYESVLDLNGIKWDHSQGTLYTWLKHREQEHNTIVAFINKELGKAPIAAFLIDHPTFPSAGRTTVLGIRNESGCFYFWRSTDENMSDFKRQTISRNLFDQISNRLNGLKQRSFENMGGPEKAYAGFLSTMNAGETKQLLLHINEFLEFDTENQEILRVGRIVEIENSLQVNNN